MRLPDRGDYTAHVCYSRSALQYMLRRKACPGLMTQTLSLTGSNLVSGGPFRLSLTEETYKLGLGPVKMTQKT